MPELYWPQEALHSQTYPTEANVSLSQQYDFTNISTDLFQPEEIFQIDQSPTVKTDFIHTSQNADSARSPSTLLDLGSGTIHREFKTEDYWSPSLGNMLINDDSNNSSTSTSRFNMSQSPDNTNLGLNNNVTQVGQPPYLEPKVETAFSLVKPQFYHPCSEDTGYKPSHFEFQETKMPYHVEEKGFQTFETYHTQKMYCKQSYQDEYIDLAHYNEYNNFLNVYDNQKLLNNESSAMFNDLDFRISNPCVPTMNNVHSSYSHDNFDVISHQ